MSVILPYLLARHSAYQDFSLLGGSLPSGVEYVRHGAAHVWSATPDLDALAQDAAPFPYNLAGSTILGLRFEAAATDLQGSERRDLTSGWTSGGGGVGAAKDATGVDGAATACTTLTASGANGTFTKAVTAGSADYTFSAWVKRKTGTGRVDITVDGGTTWNEITAHLLGGGWVRIGTDDLGPGFTGANPTVGFRLVTSGDAIYADYVQLEAGAVKTAEIPNGTTKRRADHLWFDDLDGGGYGYEFSWADFPAAGTRGAYVLKWLRVSSVTAGTSCALHATYLARDGAEYDEIATGVALTAQDTTPTFSPSDFTDATDVAVSTTQTSGAVQVSSVEPWAAISVGGSGGSSHQFRITADSGGTDVLVDWTSTATYVLPGEYVWARHTSSSSNSTAATTTITIGGTGITYQSTTVAASFTPKVAIFPGGTNGYYEFDNTGLSDSDKFTIAFFCRFDNLASSSRAVFTIGDNYFLVYADTTGALLIQAKNSAGTNVINSTYGGCFAIDTDYGVLINGALEATPVVEVVVNNSVKTKTGGPPPSTGTIDFSRTAKPRIGSNIFNVHYMDGEIGMLWLVTGTSLDASDNYANFFDTGTNKAKDLGTSGVVASTTPHYYVRWGDDVTDNSGSVDTVVNRGSLGSTATEKAADQITYGDA